MKRKLISILIALAPVFTMTACSGKETSKATPQHPVVITDHVLDIGTITDFDEESFMKYYENQLLVPNGGCSCILTQVDGNNLVGRNTDMGLSENAAFKFVLDINKYKAIGLSYSPGTPGLNYDNVLKNGVDENALNSIPYTASDYLNEKGLYIETNNRSYEEGLEVTGTNPDSDVNVFLALFPAYAVTRCATVDEVVELAKSVNIYNSIDPSKAPVSNYAFMLADAQGNYGLLEVAGNKVAFLKGQNGHANYYVTPEFAENQKYASGESRYKVLNEGLGEVKTMDDMLEHMRKAHYSQAWAVKDLDKATFDVRSEFVNYIPVNDKGEVDMENGDPANCTAAWLTDEGRRDEVFNLLQDINKNDFGQCIKEDGTYDYDELRKAYGTMPDFWVSAFTIAADCSQKTMKVRFWENPDDIFEFSF